MNKQEKELSPQELRQNFYDEAIDGFETAMSENQTGIAVAVLIASCVICGAAFFVLAVIQ